MSDENSDPPVTDAPDPDNGEKSPGEGRRDDSASKPSASDDKRHSEDDQALENELHVVNNFYFIGNTIEGSAIGPNAQFLAGIRQSTKTTRKEENQHEKDVIENWETWLREKRIQDQAFVISLLFFPGNPPNFIARIANELVLLLGEKIEDTTEKPSIFNKGVSIGSFTKDGLVSIERQSITTEAGKLEFESISITNKDALLAIKQAIFQDYDLISLRGVIRQWLIGLIKSDNKKIERLGSIAPDLPRLQAGLGLGLLARSEVDALPVIIRPWASSENPNDRLMVGWILLGYFEEDSQNSYWSNVSSLLRHWSSLDNYYYRWTAVASTTRLALIASPEDDEALMLCMSIYKDVCKSGQVNLFTGKFRGVLLRSLKFVFQLSAYHARTVILELSSWLDDEQTPNVKDLAAELFVEILNVGITVNEDVSRSGVISIWELCEMENYTVTDGVCNLLDQVLHHQKGTFVDYSVKQVSKSISKSLDKEIIPKKIFDTIISHLRGDRIAERYVAILFGDYMNKHD